MKIDKKELKRYIKGFTLERILYVAGFITLMIVLISCLDLIPKFVTTLLNLLTMCIKNFQIVINNSEKTPELMTLWLAGGILLFLSLCTGLINLFTWIIDKSFLMLDKGLKEEKK
jgi:hypothetical protein